MENLTGSNIFTALLVVVGVAGVLITLDQALKIIKGWKEPVLSNTEKLANDKRRLDAHEAAIEELQESNKLQGAALVALLDHQLHNGNTEQMEKARDDLLKHYMGK